MWEYKGAKDTTRLRKDELSSNELETFLRIIIKPALCDSSLSVEPFSIANPSSADRDMPMSNPPLAGSPACLEGLALESLVDLSSISSAETSRSNKEEEEIHDDPKVTKKCSRKDTDPDEVTSDLSSASKHLEFDEPILVNPSWTLILMSRLSTHVFWQDFASSSLLSGKQTLQENSSSSNSSSQSRSAKHSSSASANSYTCPFLKREGCSPGWSDC